MCAHNASGHGIGCQAVRTHIYLMINIQARERQYKFHHLTYLKELRFARQLHEHSNNKKQVKLS